MPRLAWVLLVPLWCLLAPFSAAQQEAEKRDHVAQRAEWQRSGRTAKGENAADLLHRAYQQKMAMREAARRRQVDSAKSQSEIFRAHAEPSGTPGFSNLTWQSMGPSPLVFDPTNLSSYGNVTGRVSAIAVDQNDSTGNTVYIGGAAGGVWKSINAANSDPNSVTWTPLTDDQPSLAVGSIALQPGGNVILVGTGETNSSPDSYYGMGILRSTDGGHSWTPISSSDGGTRSFRGLGFSQIAFSTANTNLVVAAAASTNGSTPGGNGAEIQGANGRGIYYSIDAGQTWTYANITDPSGPIQPGSVGDVVYDSVFGKFYAVIRWHGYYSSSDGANWTRLPFQPGGITSTGCPAAPTDNTCPEYRGSLSVRDLSGELFTIFVNARSQTLASGGGIFVMSADNGQWSQLGEADIDICGDTGAASGCGVQQGTYNLYIKAVPNGTATDLYVGAVNIFKCGRNSNNQFCTNPSSWLNLTHVYGCNPLGAPAHVHPDQHAIAFSAHSSPTHIYFGNDGGVWRALDETALASGSCSAQNPFDNLNANVGSLSEFVSFSQHPSDQGIVLGGLQDNGSPALSSASAGANGTTWQGVNNSDGGYNAIDPVSPSVFYTSIFDVSVQRCTLGTLCNQSTWTSIIAPQQVGGDGASFYPPYLLDPQNNASIVIGTCRLWRGPAVGGTYLPLSNNFSQGFATTCAGTTSSGDSKIRSIAMGGTTTGSGSQVIYAGMVGSAPLNGHVFVTTSADAGPSAWLDRTGNINPSGYDVSDIAISPYDPTGHTAYVTIMGFGTGHVFKTTDAGATWTDKSGNLPDVPVNSVVVDPVTLNTVYLATDIGVFLSIDDGATWAELGSGLPNAPAVKVKTFISGPVKKLRAVTYGRGMWEIDLPQADIGFFHAPLSFAAVVGRASGPQTVTLANNSANSVTLGSIDAGGDFSATSLCATLLNPGASCQIAVIYSPHAAGPSSSALTVTSSAIGAPRTLQLTGQAVDFSLSTIGPRPTRSRRGTPGGMMTIQRGQVATLNVALSVANSAGLTGLPPDQRTAKLACSSLPAGMRCGFSPAVIDLAQPSTLLQITVAAPSAPMARRIRNAKSFLLRVRASAGAASRGLNVPVQIQ